MKGQGLDDLPLVVAPCLGNAQRAAHGNRDSLGAEADQFRLGAKPGTQRSADMLYGCGDRQSFKGGADVGKRLRWFQKEITRDLDVTELPVADFEIDDDELAALYLVLTMHHCVSRISIPVSDRS